MITERLKKWAELNGCEIDENGLLHVYKAVHKVPSTDGVHYIAHYGVLDNFLRKHVANTLVYPSQTRNFDNVIEYEFGKEISIDEDKLNTDNFIECGMGLHASGLEYAKNFGKNWGDGCVIELTINLNDPSCKVVIPYDSESMKMYTAMIYIGEYKKSKSAAEILPVPADKIRTNKMTPVREVCMCHEDYDKTYRCDHMDWSLVLEVLGIKKRIAGLTELVEKSKENGTYPILKGSIIEESLEYWKGRLRSFNYNGQSYEAALWSI